MINWAQVKQLEEDIGAEDFGEVVVMFIAEVDEAIQQLRDAPPTTADEIAPALHFLKGSAFNLGFQEFGDFCGEGETLSLNGQVDVVSLEKVISLYAASKTEFMENVSSHCSFTPE